MQDYPRVERFESATVILPVLNETYSLTETVEIIVREAGDKVREFLIVVSAARLPRRWRRWKKSAAAWASGSWYTGSSCPFWAGPARPSTWPAAATW